MSKRLSSVLAALLILGGLFVGASATTAGAAVGEPTFTQTDVNYSCRGVGFAIGSGTLPNQTVTLTMIAPKEVTAGQTYDLTVDITPLQLQAPPFATQDVGKIRILMTGGSGSAGTSAVSPPVVYNGGTATVPQSKMTVTPTAAVGSSVRAVADSISVITGSTGFACSVVAGQTKAEISTAVVGAVGTTTTTSTTTTTTTTTIPGQTTTTTTTIPGQTTTTTTAPSTTTTPTLPPTTLPPTTTAPPATTTTAKPSGNTTTTTAKLPASVLSSTAQLVTKSTSASFTCRILRADGSQFNAAPIPASTVNAIVTLPDRVGVGGTINGSIQLSPAPKNGPVELDAGTVTFVATMSVNGASPTTITASGGPNGSTIPPNGSPTSPAMAFSATATAAAGSNVTFGVTKVELKVSRPLVLVTSCTPNGGMGGVGSVAVSADAVAAPAGVLGVTASNGGVASSTGGGSSAASGYANCGEAKADGRGVIPRSDPAYKASLDGDNDGLACETGDPAVLGSSLARSGSNTPLPLGALSTGLIAAGIAVGALGRRRR